MVRQRLVAVYRHRAVRLKMSDCSLTRTPVYLGRVGIVYGQAVHRVI